jgi:hypothetical protein
MLTLNPNFEFQHVQLDLVCEGLHQLEIACLLEEYHMLLWLALRRYYNDLHVLDLDDYKVFHRPMCIVCFHVNCLALQTGV